MKKIGQILLISGMVIAGLLPGAVVSYAAPFAYIPNMGTSSILVIGQATNRIATTIAVRSTSVGIAVNAGGTGVYVTDFNTGTVSVIDGATHTVIGGPITVGTHPRGVVVNPPGSIVG